MSAPWRVLDFSHFEGRISSITGGIKVEPRQGETVTIPVADVAVVLIGISVSFSSAVIHRLTAADVAVLFCDWKGVPESAAYSWSDHSRVGARQLAQLELSEPRRKNAWGQIVKAKVTGQRNTLLNRSCSKAPRLNELLKEVRSGDPSNVEAQAARVYWQSLFDVPFQRIPGARLESGFNPCLDYAYTILRGYGIRAVLGAGLHPAFGVFHRNRANMFHLVDDLIEPFRPAVDELVAMLPPTSTVEDKMIKKLLMQAASQKFSSDGSTIPTVLLDLAQQYGRYIEGEIDKLPVPVWHGPTEVL